MWCTNSAIDLCSDERVDAASKAGSDLCEIVNMPERGRLHPGRSQWMEKQPLCPRWLCLTHRSGSQRKLLSVHTPQRRVKKKKPSHTTLLQIQIQCFGPKNGAKKPLRKTYSTDKAVSVPNKTFQESYNHTQLKCLSIMKNINLLTISDSLNRRKLTCNKLKKKKSLFLHYFLFNFWGEESISKGFLRRRGWKGWSMRQD